MKSVDHPWKSWSHVVKLDPDRWIQDQDLERLLESGTDAFLIGGTQGITYEKTASLLERIRHIAGSVPIWQEISTEDAVVPGVEGYGIPVVLNAGHLNWLIGKHLKAVQKYGAFIPWNQVVAEGYIVLNGEAAVARLTEAIIPESLEEAISFAVTGERIFGLKTLYLEYSGTYGNPEWVREIRRVTACHLVYGGGITTPERAAQMAALVDTVVVGNALYEQGADLIRETVEAVKEVKRGLSL